MAPQPNVPFLGLWVKLAFDHPTPYDELSGVNLGEWISGLS